MIGRGVNPSVYDRKIGFERLATGQANALNEVLQDWRFIGAAMGKRSDVRDSEAVSAGVEDRALMSRFVLRDSGLTRGIKPADRLILRGVWDASGILQSGDIWTIKGVKQVSGARHAEIEITAVTSNGG